VTLDGTAVEVDTRKAIALLAYLAVEESASRDTLATLFWADSSTERARATLRRTLSSLRSGVGSDTIVADRHRIGLAPEVTSDVSRFEAAIEATTEHGHDPGDVCPQCIPPLAEATDLYRGDFLQGFSVRDAPEFEDWVRTIAESLRLRAGEAFHRLAMGRASVGDYPGAIAAVTRWVELDPLHEPAHRLLMLLNAWAGDRPGSIAAYRSFVAILDSELGVPPLDETTELYEAILDEDLPPAPGMRRRIRADAGAAVTTKKELIDRQEELAQLLSAMDGIADSGRVLALTGASWMGKTRLLEELVEDLSDRSEVVLSGRAFRMEQSLPYGVAAQILHDLVPLAQAHSEHIPDWALEELTRLDPRLGATEPESASPDGELRLLEGIYTTFERIGAQTPLVVIVDDAQWIDPASAQVIAYLSRRITELNVLLIVAARSGEPVAAEVRDLLDAASASIELRPLTTESIVDLVDTPEEATRVIEATGGIPLLVQEELSGDRPETQGIARYMSDRLASISDLACQIISAAAVLTGVCDATLLRETSGRSEEEIVEAVEELVRAGLLREIPDTEGITFTLDRLEDLVYHDTSLIRRRLLHRRAAAALEARPHARTDARLAAAVAVQHHGAGASAAARWYRRAGDLSRAIYANAEAKEFYETAIALGAADAGEIRLALGELAMASGDYRDATELLTAAAAQAEGETLGLIEQRLGEVQRLRGRFDVAKEHFERAADLTPDSASLYSDWALLHHRLGDTSAALGAAERALEVARRHEDTKEVSRALNVLAVVEQDPLKSMAHVDGALELAGDDEVLRMAALNNKAHLLAEIGNTGAAIRLIEEAIEIASKTGYRHREAALRNHLADLHHRAGDTAKEQQALTEAVTLFAGIEAGEWEPELWLLSRW
jgi:DNA-binding SARP family transcriptional activator/tetratricopeptide (TPR) repeat protein/plasmid stability protein